VVERQRSVVERLSLGCLERNVCLTCGREKRKPEEREKAILIEEESSEEENMKLSEGSPLGLREKRETQWPFI